MMKNLLAVFLVFLSAFSAEAQIKKTYERVKQAVTGSAQLAELHYFPEQWEVDLSLGYRYTKFSVEGKTAGLTAYEFDNATSTLATGFNLGLSDNVYATLNWDYLVSQNISYSQPTLPSTKSTGLADPTTGAVIRVFDGSGVKLDGKAQFTLNTGDRKESDGTNNGDAKNGGHVIEVGARMIGLVTDSSQISLTADYQMNGEATSVDQVNGDTTETDKYNQTEIELSTLTKLTSDLFFGITFDYINMDSYKSTNLVTNSKTSYGSTTGKTLSLQGKYQFTPDSLIQVEGGFITDYTGSSAGFDFSVTGYSSAINYVVRF